MRGDPLAKLSKVVCICIVINGLAPLLLQTAQGCQRQALSGEKMPTLNEMNQLSSYFGSNGNTDEI